MSQKKRSLRELRELVLLTTEDEATPEQQTRLSQLLTEPELAAEAAMLIEQLSTLTDATRSNVQSRGPHLSRNSLATISAKPAVKPSNSDVRDSSRHSRGRLLAIAACLMLTHLAVAGLAWYGLRSPVEFQPAAARGLIDNSSSPQVVSLTACVWESSSTKQPLLGQSLQKGEVLNLLEGIAEIDLGGQNAGRARVRVEGPASVFVRADGLLGLRHGILTADVTVVGDSFVVDTPLGRVVVPEHASLGIIASGERNEVHVFDGQLAIELDQDSMGVPVAVVDAGSAVALRQSSNGGISTESKASSLSAFASARSMEFDRLSLSDHYRDAVLACKPAVYWRFDDGDEEVINEGSAVGMNAVVDGAVSWQQVGENRVAEFGLLPTPGSFRSRGYWPSRPLESYTVEMWIKPSHYHNGAAATFVGARNLDNTYQSSFLLEYGGAGDRITSHIPANGIRFLHRSPPGNRPEAGTSCISEGPYAVRQWQHVVARKQDARMDLLVDGVVVATRKDPTPLPVGTRVVVGQLYPSSDEVYHRPFVLRSFVGQLDEFALYGRALTDEEIQSHHQIAKPDPAANDLARPGSI